MVTLTVCKDVVRKLSKTFLCSELEEGFILGCRTRLDHVDCCEQIPAIQAGIHYYEPDSSYANHVIHNWQKQGMCFCGFIHSHVVNKQDLSEADMQFAEALIRAYKLPVLWFGLAVVSDGVVSFSFHSVTKHGSNIHICPVAFEQKSNIPKEDIHESLHR